MKILLVTPAPSGSRKGNRVTALRWARLLRATAHGELGEYSDTEADFANALRQANDPLGRYVILTNRSGLSIRRQRWDARLVPVPPLR